MKTWNRTSKGIAPAAAAVVALCPLTIGLFFGHRLQGIDDLVLANPIYMYLTTGHWTYPIHGEPDRFIIHPPLNYVSIAFWMKSGLSAYYAYFLTVCLLSVLAILATLRSSYTPLIKCVFITAFSLTSILYLGNAGTSIRPDFHMFVAWFFGTMMLADDNPSGKLWRPFAGGFLLVYAAALAWVAVGAMGGIVIYVLLNLRRLNDASARASVIAAIAGGLCVGVPYLIFYIIPNFHSMHRILLSAFLTGGLFAGAKVHVDIYQSMLSLGQRDAAWWLLQPFYYFYLPTFAVGAVLLSFHRQTRRFAVIGLPMCLFIFLSGYKWPVYLYPEDFLLIAGELLLLGAVVVGAARFASLSFVDHSAAALTVVAFGLVFLYLWLVQAFLPQMAEPRSRVLEADVARAAALQLVGPDARIAGRIGLWYVSGAHRWNTDFAWVGFPAFDPDKLIRSFDYIVDHGFLSDLESSPNGKTFLGAYVDGTFRLRAFIHARSAVVRTLFFSAGVGPVTGYVAFPENIRRFDEATNGDWVFATMECPRSIAQNLQSRRDRLDHMNVLLLPPVVGMPPRALVTTLSPVEEFAAIRPFLESQCRVRDAIIGTLHSVELGELLSQAKAIDRPMVFAPTPGPTEEMLARAVSVPLDGMVPASANSLQHEGGMLIGRSLPTPWAYVGRLDLGADCVASGGWVSVELRGKSGQIGVGLLNRAGDTFLARRWIAPSESFQSIHLPVVGETGGLIVQNGGTGVSSEVEIRSVKLITEDLDAPICHR